MFNLEKTEKSIIIFLSFTLMLGLAAAAYIKLHPKNNIQISKLNRAIEDARKDARININEAGVDGLTKLKGVGSVLARRIVDYRESSGRFACIEDVKKVRGVGDSLFNKIKDDIYVE